MILIEMRQGAADCFVATAAYHVRNRVRTCEVEGKTRAHAVRRILARLRRNGHAGKDFALMERGETDMKGHIPDRAFNRKLPRPM